MAGMSGRSASEAAERIQRMMFLKLKAIRWRFAPRKTQPRTVFVSGVHRSGTNMLMEVLEASYEADIYHESDPRAFEGYNMRGPEVIRSLIDRSRAPVVVVKGLHEAQRMNRMMEDFAPAKCLWMIRRFEDAVNSMVTHWPGLHNFIHRIVVDRNAGGWRGLGMTDETHRIVRMHYRRDMNFVSANALFWYYRNQLFFDQHMDRDPRVLPIQYEELVTSPEAVVARIADFVGIRSTKRMWRIPHSGSMGKSAAPDIAPDIRDLCESMQKRLGDAARRKLDGRVEIAAVA
jgi:hypothetical protein